MSEAITYKAVGQRFSCGHSYTNLMVVRFFGPENAKACAYCCNMNLDVDGEPQAYAPLNSPRLTPLDNLWNGGFLDAARNAAKKTVFDAAEKAYNDLVATKATLASKAKSGTPIASGEITKIDKQIADALKIMLKAGGGYWNGKGAKPKNWGTIFWHWYGLIALTPDAAAKLSFSEDLGKGQRVTRRPILNKTAMYEDVHGKFPVVQSQYEPGPGYFVSVLPQRTNVLYPIWDQRAFLPPDLREQIAYAALSTVLEKATGVHLQDTVLAVRLDDGKSLSFPFLDRGFKPKVGECSIRAFTGLGGVVARNMNASRNDFVLLYVAFPGSAGNSPYGVLQKFSRASNAEDFLLILAFLSQATTKARGKRSGLVKVGANPLNDFEKWKKTSSSTLPTHFELIKDMLYKEGFKSFADRMMRKHPTLGPQGTLQPPKFP